MASPGADIQKRRAAFGFTPTELADLAALPEARVLAIESGAVQVTTSDLALLADALACDAADLARGELDDARRSPARFRGAIGGRVPSPHDLRLLARAAETGRILASLRGRLGEPAAPLQDLRSLSAPSPAMEPWEHGYQLGAKAREQLHPGPLLSVQAMLESWGVHIAEVAFESDEIEAASLYETGAAPVILVNSRAGKARYRPSLRAILAHELCHLLHDGGQRNLTAVSLEKDSSPVKQRANGFAPSFLAPGARVSLRSAEPSAMVLELAETWGFSFEGAAWHLKNLGLIPAATADRLIEQQHRSLPDTPFERPMHRTPPDQFGIEVEPSPLALGLLSETAIIAAAEGLISRGRAAEILLLR